MLVFLLSYVLLFLLQLRFKNLRLPKRVENTLRRRAMIVAMIFTLPLALTLALTLALCLVVYEAALELWDDVRSIPSDIKSVW